MRGLGTEAMELGDERRRAFETVLDHAGDIGVAQRVPPARDAPAVVARGQRQSAVRRSSRRPGPDACVHEQGGSFHVQYWTLGPPFMEVASFRKGHLPWRRSCPSPSPPAQLMRAFIKHRANLPADTTRASDQVIVDLVDDINALLLRGLTTALPEGDADWFRRHAWFVDMVTAMLENAVSEPPNE